MANKCILEAGQYAKKGCFEELDQLCARSTAALQKQLTEGAEELPQDNERQFIDDYKAKLPQVKTELFRQLHEAQKKARDHIVSQLPTFIYMDDYKTFRGRANLLDLRTRRNSKSVLSEEDETFLMILKLSSLDLDGLIAQGESGDENILHDRQVDLQDAATT